MYLASQQAGCLSQHAAGVSASLNILALHARSARRVKASVLTACFVSWLSIVRLCSWSLVCHVACWTDVLGVSMDGARLGLSKNGYVLWVYRVGEGGGQMSVCSPTAKTYTYTST